MKNKRIICGLVLAVILTATAVLYGTISTLNTQPKFKDSDKAFIEEFRKFSTENKDVNTMKNLEVKNDLQSYGIKVISSNNTNFNDELMKYVGNNDEVIPLVDVAKPFALFIKNDSSKEIVGIALQWEFAKSNGEINKVNQIETSPGVLMGMKPYDPFMIGKTSLINSNSHRFISYFYGISEQLLNAFNSNSYKRFEYKLGSEKAQDYISDAEYQKEMILRDVSSVSVIVDGIIFNDGTFIGKNQSFLFETMDGIVQAKRNFLKKLREAKQFHKSDTESLNEFISEMQFISEDRQPSLNYVNGKEAFDQTYKYKMISFMKEITSKRSKSTDSYILEDFLRVRDSEFIELKRK